MTLNLDFAQEIEAIEGPTPPGRERVYLQLDLPRKLSFLLDQGKYTYKVAWGGRNSLKSWSFARALLCMGVERDLRVLCLRETQRSIADSVHLLLTDQIKALGYEKYYHVTDNSIRGTARNTLFRFTGLSDQTQQGIKSYEGFDIFWFEEAQRITKRSFQIALPTLLRTVGAEAWVSFNPDLDSDEVWDRFIVHPPENACVVEMNYRDAAKVGWMTDENERLRQYDLIHSPDEYENIWEGRPRTFVQGAIYGREITDMVKDGRFRPMPYDPRLPVHRVWDLGWNDLMTVVMVQKPIPSALSLINYIEDSRVTYAEMLQTMSDLRYRWGTDWLPHDATQHHPTSGTNAVRQLRELGCRVRLIPKSNPEARIRAARMMFPRIYLDSDKREVPPDRPDRVIGGAHLMDRLKHYRRHVPRGTNEPTAPLHDVNSHAADAFGALAEIVDQIRNEGEDVLPAAVMLPAYVNPVEGMGLLG